MSWVPPEANVIPPGWGLTAEGLFADGRVVVWRRLAERENAVLEVGGERFHVKRYLRDGAGQVRGEVGGIGRLLKAGIPTVELVAWGVLADGRGFTVTRDLGAGWVSGQAFLREGGRFEQIAGLTAGLARRLHGAGLCHRDLYLCHYFVERGGEGCRLIDAGRVRQLGWWGMGGGWRWVAKDLAQTVYSMSEFGLSREVADGWLDLYAGGRMNRWRRAWVWGKVGSIARHDRRLRSDRPGRAVSLPAELGGVGGWGGGKVG